MVIPNSPPGISAIPSFNHCQGDNSDAAPANEDCLTLSSTLSDLTHNLLLGDVTAVRVWRFDPAQINLPSDRQKFSVSYIAAR